MDLHGIADVDLMATSHDHRQGYTASPTPLHHLFVARLQSGKAELQPPQSITLMGVGASELHHQIWTSVASRQL